MESRINLSRSCVTCAPYNYVSYGLSYTHIKSLKGIVGPDTTKIVMYHSMVNNLSGLEDAKHLEFVYLGFNSIYNFNESDSKINCNVLDLAGNPIKSLEYCPPVKQLIVSSTMIEDLEGCPEGVEIIRCGHSSFLKSLVGCPKSVKLIECRCTPNLSGNLPDWVDEIIKE